MDSRHKRENIYKKCKEQKLKPIVEQRIKLEKEKTAIIFKITSLYNDRLDKRISEEQYKKSYNELVNERNKIDKLLKDVLSNEQRIEDEGNVKEKIKEMKRAYRKLSINQFDYEDLAGLIKKIELTNNTINIQFTFNQ